MTNDFVAYLLVYFFLALILSSFFYGFKYFVYRYLKKNY